MIPRPELTIVNVDWALRKNVKYQHRPLYPVEFEFAVECCKWVFAGGDRGAIDRLVRRINPDRFLAVARRHRVQGLIWHCLAALKVPIAGQLSIALKDDARRIVEDGLRAANEMARLYRAFNDDGVPCIFLKGLTLGKLAYCNPYLKMGWDIDLLVPPTAIPASTHALERRGYRLSAPALQVRSPAFEQWHRKRKESVWYKADGHIHVELHSALADNAHLIPGIGVNSPLQSVELAPGIVLPTLAPDELFAYLCVHGASSAWFRLKWITDLAALLHGRDAQQVERLYRRSQQLGAGRAAGQAVLLATWLYGSPISPALAAALERDPAIGWLARTALAEMTGRAAIREPGDAVMGTAMIHLSQFFLLPGWRFKASEFLRQLSAIGA